MAEQEIEVKFYINDIAVFEKRLVKIGASVKHPRVYEENLRFDTHDGVLTREHRVLRLRRDSRFRLTYKDPALGEDAVSIRKEIEFEVSSYEETRLLLEALGYQVSVVYEKYRTTYEFYETEIVLDEMPYGNFVEIEGPDIPTIQLVAAKLGLNWEARSVASYMALFDRLLEKRRLSIRNLTFAEFQGIMVLPADLGLQASDLKVR
ncbi:MAG: class IV adenylate cyclase [Anaerolineaceae bacterium]|nr:class IV adenylate cyclase [Anaerolineaceae bacterium]